MEGKNLYVNNDLTRLSKYLNYQLSTTLLFALSFMFGFFLLLLIGAAIVFTPYMLYVLYQENRKGWIIFFIILVIIPLIAAVIISFTVTYIFPLYLIVIGLFYLYCFLLRLKVNNWLCDRRARMQYILEKQRCDDETKAFMSQLDK